MKAKIISFLLLALFSLQGMAQDWNDRMWTGLQGPVVSVKSQNEEMTFNNDGFYTSFNMYLGDFKLETDDINHAYGEVYGSGWFASDNGRGGADSGYWDYYKLEIDGGRMVGMTLGEYEDYGVHIEYNAKGQPTEMVLTENHENFFEVIFKYSNYKTDAYGNWTSRTVSEKRVEYDWWSGSGNQPKTKTKSKSYTETRRVEYKAGFLDWNAAWPAAKRKGDMETIEQYATSPLTCESYKTEAEDYWNAHIVDYMQKSKATAEQIFKTANSAVCQNNTASALREMARAKIFNEEVMAETDYYKVQSYAFKEFGAERVFDDNYKAKINRRAKELLEAKIEQMLADVASDIKREDYDMAITTCNNILAIDQSNKRASQLLADADYGKLMKMSNAGQATDEDYQYFLNRYPNSAHCTEVGSILVTKALEKNGSMSNAAFACYLDGLNNVPMTDDVRANYITVRGKAFAKAERDEKRRNTRSKRGPFCGFNLGYNFGFAKSEMFGGAEAGMRFGYQYQFLNLWIGAKYQLNSGYMMADTEEPGGYLTCNTLTVPAVLRLNLVKDYAFDLFLGLGAEYTMPLKARYAVVTTDTGKSGSEYEYIKSDKSKDFAGAAFIAPRVSLGISMRYMEIELFGTYNLDDKYNAASFRMQDVPAMIGEQFETQVKGKVNVGMAFRFGF